MSWKLFIECGATMLATLVALPIEAISQLPVSVPPDGKWLCIIEKAAGILYNEETKDTTARAVRFDERHRFTVSIARIKRYDFNRQFCKQSLGHWESMLYGGGDYPDEIPPSSSDPKKLYDYRINIGPNCFSNREAIIKYFDSDNTPSRLVSYDYLPWAFEGLPGSWMTFRSSVGGMTFQGSEPLDAGPVVIEGSCQRID